MMIVTVHSKHTVPYQVIKPIKQSGWDWIRQNWYSAQWLPVPEWVKSELKLHPAIGVCGGNFVTKVAATGINEFVQRLNSIGG
jgi:hypothetical protein